MAGSARPNLGLFGGYAQHDNGWGIAGYNPAMNLLDTVVQAGVISDALATPPGTPANGDRYLVASSPTGAWAGQAGKLAVWLNSAWVFYTPKRGWRVHRANSNSAPFVYFDGSAWVTEPVSPRKQMTTTKVIWVTGSIGSDSVGAATGGEDFGNGFATIQGAIDYVTKTVDGGGTGVALANAIQIQLYAAGGPYDAVNLSGLIPGDGLIWIVGNGATLTGTGADAIRVQANAKLMISGVTLTTTGSGHCIYATTGAQVTINSDVVFGACAQSHLDCSYGGQIVSAAPYTISGGAQSHYHARNGGTIGVAHAVTLTGTPAFSAYFAGVSWGLLETIGATYTGSATGSRFTAHYGGVIRTVLNPGDSSLTYFPGSTAGVVSGGGIYDYATGGGGISDAPSNGLLYGRKDGAWEQILPDAGSVEEAPSDDTSYARKNGTWAALDLTKPLDVGLFIPGTMPAGNTLLTRYVFTRSVSFPSGLTGSQGYAGTAPGASTTLVLRKNGTNIGTANFASGASVATFTFASSTSFAAGDRLEVLAPASPDGTIADISLTLAGTRT